MKFYKQRRLWQRVEDCRQFMTSCPPHPPHLRVTTDRDRPRPSVRVRIFQMADARAGGRGRAPTEPRAAGGTGNISDHKCCASITRPFARCSRRIRSQFGETTLYLSDFCRNEKTLPLNLYQKLWKRSVECVERTGTGSSRFSYEKNLSFGERAGAK